jgi:hypothetical protein
MELTPRDALVHAYFLQQSLMTMRAAGHQHPRALRGLADRLLGVLIALLKTQKTFDRARREGTFAQSPLIVAFPSGSMSAIVMKSETPFAEIFY